MRIIKIANRLFFAGVADRLLKKHQKDNPQLTVEDINNLRDLIKKTISGGLEYDNSKIDIVKQQDQITKLAIDLCLSEYNHISNTDINKDSSFFKTIEKAVIMISVLIYLKQRYPRYNDEDIAKWYKKDIGSFKTYKDLKRHFDIHKDLLEKDNNGFIALKPIVKSDGKANISVDSLPTEATISGYTIKRLDSKDQIPTQNWTDLECGENDRYCITTKNWFGQYGGPPYFWVLKKSGDKYKQEGMIIPSYFEKDIKQALRDSTNTKKMPYEMIKELMPFLLKHGIVGKYGAAIQFIDNPSEEVQLKAVNQNGNAINFIIDKGIKPSEAVQLKAVGKYGSAIKHIDNPSEEVQLKAVETYGTAINFIIDKGIKPSEAVQLKAVGKYGAAIQFIDNPSEEIQLKAVNQNGNAIKYIIDKGIKPSEAVQLKAVEEDGLLIKYIIDKGINPSEAVKEMANRKKTASIQRKAHMLKFACKNNAIQYLSDYTKQKIIIAGFQEQKPYLKKELLKNNIDNEEEILKQIMEADPIAAKTKGKKAPFTKQITKWLVDKKINLPEDINTVKETLQKYNQYKSQIGKPISSFDSPGDIRKELDQYIEKKDEDDYKNKAKLIDKYGEYKLYKIENYDQGKICFEDSGWCVKEKSYFENYKPPFYMVTKGNKRYALLHIDRHQLKDVYDNALTLETAKPISKFILDLFPNYSIKGDLLKLIDLYDEKTKIEFITKSPSLIDFIQNPSEKIQLTAINKYPYAIEYIKNPSEEIQLEAIKNNPEAAKKIKNISEKAQLELIKKDSSYIRNISNPSEEAQLKAVSQNGYSIAYIKNPSEAVQLAAVEQDGPAIEYIKDPSEEIQLAAINQFWESIKYIKNPTEKVQLEVLKKNPKSLSWINNPSDKIKEMGKQKAASLKFSNKKNAIQYLSDYTSNKIIIASSIKPDKNGKYIPPQAAKKSAQKVLDWKEKYPNEVKAMTKTGWTRARQLASGEPISLDIVKRMAKFYRHKSNSKINPKYKSTPWKDNGWVSWEGWGGDTGINWARKVVERLKNE